MKKKLCFLFCCLLSIIFLSFVLVEKSFSAEMENYCYVPPFVGHAIRPNVLFVVDVSGSMSWRAYSNTYNPSITYEGYFIPDKHYKKSHGIWEETADPINNSTVFSGSYLNWVYMTRIDLLRWAITGGRPESCSQVGTLNPNFCDPFLYGSNGAQVSCDDSGCILETYDSEKVKVPWWRLKEALVYKFKKLSIQPRIGVMFFSDTGVRSTKVYIGDYMGRNAQGNDIQIDNLNPYKNLISAINYEDPDGATPTAPALWDAYNYFSQNSPEYGGFDPQSGWGDRWRNPMYQCFNVNNNDKCEANEFKLVPCVKNFIILLTDGQWNTPSCYITYGFEDHSADPVVPAYWLHKKGFKNKKVPSPYDNETFYVDAIYGIGLWLGGTGEQSLKNVAMYGSFDRSKEWPDNLTGYPDRSCYMDNCGNGRGSACTPLPTSSPDWDENGDGVPDTFFNAQNAKEIRDSIYKAILDILKRASSGATVATLGARRNYSSIMLQPFFYPRYSDKNNKEVSWIGFLRSFWVDFEANFREDDVEPKWLNLKGSNVDTIFQFVIKENERPNAWEIDNLTACEASQRLESTELKPVFEVGCKLADTSPDDRNIFVNYNGTLTQYSDSGFKNWLESLWKSIDSSLSDTDANCLYSYLTGEMDASCNASDWVKRERTFDVSSVCSEVSGEKWWKLGDIIFSSPTIISNDYNNIYHLRYLDYTYLEYIASNSYRERNTYAIVGANDGMIHCFRVGVLNATSDSEKPFRLIDAFDSTTTNEIGKEEWAFIPKNALPYLVWFGKKDYCHVPTVDYRTFVVDASIEGDPNDNKTKDSWRTLLIGMMGFGGKALTVNNITYSSSIFVLDLTDWLESGNPSDLKLLWEKELPDHTLTLSFPAIIRLGDPSKNGNWYLVIGSGPKDPEGTIFDNATIYFFNLKDGTLVKELPIKEGSTFVEAAVGDIIPLDLNNDYQDDAIYFGTYTQNSGNFYRIQFINSDGTYKDIASLNEDDVEKIFAINRPIFAAPAFTRDEKGNLWAFFGTGRFLNSQDRDFDYTNYLVGFKVNSANSFPLTLSELDNRTGSSVTITVTRTEKVCKCDWDGCSKKDIVVDGVLNGTAYSEPTIGWFQELR
jgi:type IV pilus assembly protein PilY1